MKRNVWKIVAIFSIIAAAVFAAIAFEDYYVSKLRAESDSYNEGYKAGYRDGHRKSLENAFEEMDEADLLKYLRGHYSESELIDALYYYESN